MVVSVKNSSFNLAGKSREASVQITREEWLGFVADHAKHLAEMAQNAKHEALAYIFSMAELEARNLLVSKEEKRKNVA